jgi:hypothetical protein
MITVINFRPEKSPRSRTLFASPRGPTEKKQSWPRQRHHIPPLLFHIAFADFCRCAMLVFGSGYLFLVASQFLVDQWSPFLQCFVRRADGRERFVHNANKVGRLFRLHGRIGNDLAMIAYFVKGDRGTVAHKSSPVNGSPSPVITARTPGIENVFSVWIPRMHAWAYGLVTSLACSIPTSMESYVYFALPVTLSHDSLRMTLFPINSSPPLPIKRNSRS